ncbi:Phenylalanyl-tRNA synthetase subunit alpha [Spraguea lophii 42_110]|uniref:Probable phenylalanine--tRNA ligase alpha subunit n=1 Tax=Spraguea lophii (strain 42_110) TaxID=1358809 RepID=S7WA80_SPRLO|nr:Phenylalanyl-tRNA synthetase subunit alpha [Spraguea lophii 42_110]
MSYKNNDLLTVDNFCEKITEILISSESLSLLDMDEKIHGAILKLESLKKIKYQIEEKEYYGLTNEAVDVVEKGSPEYIYIENIRNNGDGEFSNINVTEDGKKNKKGSDRSIGFSYAMKNKWIQLKDNKIVLCDCEIKDGVRENLGRMKEVEDRIKDFKENYNIGDDIEIFEQIENMMPLNKKDVEILKKRKYLIKKKIRKYLIEKDVDFYLDKKNLVAEVTAEMINNPSTDYKNLKDYNFNTAGNLPKNGALHPLNKIKEEFRQIFLQLGFEEMDTSRYVESSFWNFDALFQPQDHPSRDLQDTFFLSNPKTTKDIPEEYMKKIKDIHSIGGYGSDGYKGNWKEEETRKNVLRTHTTAISTKYLYEIMKQRKDNGEEFKPFKLFAIDRVFRNESLDATHLSEFQQIEGLVCDKNLNLSNLMGILEEFFKKLKFEKIKFKPAYNPYTEPSLEIFAYHPILKKWMEVGNSGIFRPEMLRPMGYEEDVRVIAWGLSLERPAMIKYGINNIRDLVGHTVGLDFIREGEIVSFE